MFLTLKTYTKVDKIILSCLQLGRNLHWQLSSLKSRISENVQQVFKKYEIILALS